jgi:hypothetical protein
MMKIMRWPLLIVILCSCAHRPPADEEELVSVQVALMHAQASYLKGCVEAMKELGVPVAFHGCRDRAFRHRRELDAFMAAPPEDAPQVP